jgi:glycosyltransferase involved in cell wall biosynthesis
MSISVSVVLPCGYGDKYFRVALGCFLSQAYDGPLEVIILDNNTDPIQHLLPKDERIRYFQCERDRIGALRNKANALATGDVIVNGDEDDWYSADRIASQVARLKVTGKRVTGWHNVLFYNTADGGCYRYNYAGKPPYAVGTSLTYTRAWWLAHPFQAVLKGTDYYFQLEAAQADQLDSVDSAHYGVARAHRDSTSPPAFGSCQFPVVPKSALPDEFWRAIP